MGKPNVVVIGAGIGGIATAAHITHMLRDMSPDITEGFINIPVVYLEAHGINPEDMESLPFRAWVRSRVELAREYFREGKRYLDELDVKLPVNTDDSPRL